MSAAKNVYIIIFVMLLLPIVFFSIKGYVKPKNPHKPKVQRILSLVYGGVGVVLSVVACLYLYQFTIAHQPLLLSERAAVICLDSQRQGTDPLAALEKQGLAAPGATVDLTGLDAVAFDQVALQMPQKLQVAQGGVGYPVLLDNDATYCVLGIVVDESQDGPKIASIKVYLDDDAKAYLDGKMTFYTSSTYRLPK